MYVCMYVWMVRGIDRFGSILRPLFTFYVFNFKRHSLRDRYVYLFVNLKVISAVHERVSFLFILSILIKII